MRATFTVLAAFAAAVSGNANADYIVEHYYQGAFQVAVGRQHLFGGSEASFRLVGCRCPDQGQQIVRARLLQTSSLLAAEFPTKGLLLKEVEQSTSNCLQKRSVRLPLPAVSRRSQFLLHFTSFQGDDSSNALSDEGSVAAVPLTVYPQDLLAPVREYARKRGLAVHGSGAVADLLHSEGVPLVEGLDQGGRMPALHLYLEGEPDGGSCVRSEQEVCLLLLEGGNGPLIEVEIEARQVRFSAESFETIALDPELQWIFREAFRKAAVLVERDE